MQTYDPEDVVEELRRRVAALGVRRIAAGVAAALVLIFLWSMWFTVQPEETAIVQRFGAVNRTVGPGLHFKFPDGIEKVRRVPTARVLKEEFGFGTAGTGAGGRTQYAGDRKGFKEVSLMLTGDLNVIDVQWIVQYRIEDPASYLFRVRESRQTIRDIAEAVMRRVVGNRLGSDVLTVGRVAVSTEVKGEMQKILTEYQTGVRLVTVELQDVTPPDPVKPAFNEVNEARQDRERTINQAQERANREIPKARGEAARTIKKFLESVATEAGARSRLNDIIDSVVRDQVSGSELGELVRSASWEVPKSEVLEDVPAEVKEELKKEVVRGREEITRTILAEARKVIPQYGIELVDVRIKRLDYVESVREKVYARMISERKRIAAQFRSEGEGQSAQILGTMEKELRQIRSGAYRTVQEIRGKADAEATRVYGAAYSADPEFYAFSRTLEAYKEGQNRNSVVILTTDSDYYRYLKQSQVAGTPRPAR